MAPIPTSSLKKPQGDLTKSWRKLNEERKEHKKKQKQDKLLREYEKAEKLKELAKNIEENPEEKHLPPSTISIAVPGSILENAQTSELRTYVAGQIARAACIFRVDEIIIFDDICLATAKETKVDLEVNESGETTTKTVRSSSLQLGRILQYLECPQYLRKFFFPLHKDLQYSGLLNPLDAPHHLRQQNLFLYREGVVSEKKAKDGWSYVNVGLLHDVLVDQAVTPGVRVTVRLENLNEKAKKLRGVIVSPQEPRQKMGVYWGYTVRIAHSLSEIFTNSSYEGGYDITIGTSDRGTNIHEIPSKSYSYNHLLLVFGGIKGLEEALENDESLNVNEPELLFDHYLNVLPNQGSRTIRTEEALLVALAALQDKLNPKQADIIKDLTEFLPKSEDTGMPLHDNTDAPLVYATKRKFKPRRNFEDQQQNGETDEIVQPKRQNEMSRGRPPFAKERGNQATSGDGERPFNRDQNKASTSNFKFDKTQRKSTDFSFNKSNVNNPFNPNSKKNPFKPKPKSFNDKPSSNDDNDFEIVPASSRSKNNINNGAPAKVNAVDLSRFD